ncbi:MAG: hypothetical protein NT116_00475, partial [Candidatus Parcubacteria bacterium]|nr:hypothetical protein [Candidatus Parcubacteria bacterium]
MESGKKAYSQPMMEQSFRLLAQGGKLKDGQLGNFKENFGFMEDQKDFQKILLFEEYEDEMQKATGERPSYSPYIMNPQTKQIEDISGLKNGRADLTNSLKQESSLAAVDVDQVLANININDLFKKRDDGTFRINKESKEYKRIQDEGSGEEKDVLHGMENSETQYKDYLKKNEKNIALDDTLKYAHPFYAFARANDIDKTKEKERIEGNARADKGQSGLLHDNVDFGNAVTKGIDNAIAQIVGVA